MTGPTPFRTHRSHLAAVIAMLVMICCAFLPSVAQTQNPPGQQQPTLQTGSAGSFGAQIVKFGVRARELMSGLQTEMMSLMRWVEYLALVLMMVVIIGSGVREWHENNWEGRNLFWWFGRLAVCLLLFGSSVGIIDELYLAGKEIAEGENHDSMLFKFYEDREVLFNASYEKVVDGNFKVTVRGQEFKVEPIDGAEAFLGVIYDQEDTIRDVTSKLNDSAYTLPRLFAILSIARGVMELGDVWLVILAGLLMMTFKVTAPFMVVLGIDRKLSQRTVNAYLWGLIVLTLIWPSVSYFIRGLAYMAGNLAMSMGDQGQVYTFADGAQKTLRFVDTQPVYTIGFGALMMLGAGLALWVSPFLAYSFSMGRVFEGVSQTASQYAASFVGAAVEWVSANVGAKISRQAERIQIQGGNEAEQERARGEKRAADLGATARLAQALGGARAQQITSLSQVWANRNNQVGMANAGRDFQNMSAFRQYQYNYRNWMAARSKENQDIRVTGKQQLAELKAGALGAEFDITGGALSGAGAVGSGIGLPMRHSGNILQWQMRGGALIEATRGRNQNLDDYYKDMNKSAGAYATDMYGANADFAAAQGAVANASAAQAAKGVNDGYMRQLHTAHRVYDLETDANQARFDAQMKATDINLRSGLQAANLRAMSHVITQVAGKVTRDIEKNMEMRF
ncbi:MAG TPA: hypothetical protein VE715_03980 [Blastocatellia bacterium]|nr:hypothetical protein [Blastocatellia bacterium]